MGAAVMGWITSDVTAVSGPFELDGVDLIGPFKETPSDHKYIFNGTDGKKWVEAYPSQSPGLIVTRLSNVVRLHSAQFAEEQMWDKFLAQGNSSGQGGIRTRDLSIPTPASYH
ncbi:hypothetical protein DPMN_023576 [Dreissena polymorpha]|uniref:Uncharacterized protein n=1 Tax=Dreissena polymorpha TaxID=45954 RepID=A0A9D4LMD1_DREPO|nr:hypothetical protein DPMN_023576 [Dreissena polymorpha]